jgi:hypothetical protein
MTDAAEQPQTPTERTDRPLIDVAVTDHPFSRMVCAAFARGCGGRLVKPEDAGARVASYGILRGCGEAMRRADEFYYIDHGFFGRSDPSKGDGYYRVIHNALWPSSEPDHSDYAHQRLAAHLEAGHLRFRPKRKTGDHIVLVPPSRYMTEYFGLHSWTDDTIAELEKHTDRDFVISEKTSTTIEHCLANAWCVVSDHSNANIVALINGIPAIFTNPVRKNSELSQIEDPPYDLRIFTRLAASMWTLDEMASGECWSALTRA